MTWQNNIGRHSIQLANEFALSEIRLENKGPRSENRSIRCVLKKAVSNYPKGTTFGTESLHALNFVMSKEIPLFFVPFHRMQFRLRVNGGRSRFF